MPVLLASVLTDAAASALSGVLQFKGLIATIAAGVLAAEFGSMLIRRLVWGVSNKESQSEFDLGSDFKGGLSSISQSSVWGETDRMDEDQFDNSDGDENLSLGDEREEYSNDGSKNYGMSDDEDTGEGDDDDQRELF
jgi:hypothetical protein